MHQYTWITKSHKLIDYSHGANRHMKFFSMNQLHNMIEYGTKPN